jgi:uncharacterized protein YbcI
MGDAHRNGGNSVSAAISNGAVRILREYTGRGPTQARTIVNRDSVMILFADTLTKGERTLAELGDASVVRDVRHRFQQAMREEMTELVEAQLGRKVIAFMSDYHIDPDMAAEVFVLEPGDEPESATG